MYKEDEDIYTSKKKAFTPLKKKAFTTPDLTHQIRTSLQVWLIGGSNPCFQIWKTRLLTTGPFIHSFFKKQNSNLNNWSKPPWNQLNSPTHRMLKQKPWATDLFTSWSGRLSKPTCPVRFRVRTMLCSSCAGDCKGHVKIITLASK